MYTRKTNVYRQMKRILKFRFFYIVLLSAGTFINVAAQNATPKVISKELPDSTLQYISPLDYAFMMHETTSWLLKGVFPTFHRSRAILKLGFEKRIAPSFTFNSGFEFTNFYLNGNPYNLSENGERASLETRWYYHLNKHMAENKVARNLSDNYLAFGIDFTHLNTYELWPSHESIKNDNYLNYYLKWGMQRRFLKHGFADMGIKAGLNQRLSYDQAIFFSLNTYVDLGLAFTKDKYTLDPEKLCPVFKCFETEKYAVKTNISNLLSVELFQKSKSVILMPNLAFEHKIASSPFSVNSGFDASFGWYKNSFEEGRLPQQTEDYYYRYRLALEGRWYSTLKHRIRIGKSGNGLSGNYIAAGAYYLWLKDTRYLKSQIQNGPNIYAAVGWQKLISTHLYYDMQFRTRYRFLYSTLEGKGWNIEATIAMGYRF